jgi:excisionase family DNA binding protein
MTCQGDAAKRTEPTQVINANEPTDLELLSVDRTATLADVHRSTVWRLIARGELETVRFGLRNRRILASSLRRYLEQQRRPLVKPVA